MDKPHAPHHSRRAVPLRAKLGLCFACILAGMTAMVYFTFSQTSLTMQETYAQESGYYNINSFMNTAISARDALEHYLQTPAERPEYAKVFWEDFRRMEQQIERFDLNIQQVGTERYLLANAIKNGFVPYTEHCTAFLSMADTGAEVNALYEEFSTIQMISGYLEKYARDLLSEALSDGQTFLADSRIRTERMYNILLLVVILLGFALLALLYELVRSIVTPVLRLSDAARAIGKGEFDTPDVKVQNRDEIYALTHAFNHMKRSMKNLVTTLQEKNEIEQQLHAREMEAEQGRRLLEQAKMQQLRSQINPHFLFNTLNIISRTARREGAKVSEKLILALARLFRYSLKTDDNEVPLQREINIVEDYLSIQTTRFENRIHMDWRVAPEIDPETVFVPAFLFQPVVENAIIHGLEPKVEGGTVRIRVHNRRGRLHLIVADDGVGMDRETLQRLLSEQSVKDDVSGIGVGNVRSRLLLLHADAQFAIHSGKGRGTVVHMSIPLPAPQACDAQSPSPA